MNETSQTKLDMIRLRFVGDSGDGMQLVGNLFTATTAMAGNDVHTFTDYPAEIRAPAGTLGGVSGFQIGYSDHEIHTPGDHVDILVALNPAALKTNLNDLMPGGTLIVNSDSFRTKDLQKVGYPDNPLENGSLDEYQVIKVSITRLTVETTANLSVSHSQAKQCKNMFALGLVFWMCGKELTKTINWLSVKFKDDPSVLSANKKVLEAGYYYGETLELVQGEYALPKAKLSPGLYRQVTGNEGLALACATLASSCDKGMLVSGYPITPASDLLQLMSRYEPYGIAIFQAEDEIAAICATIGAAYGGALALTCTSGPGFDLKSEGLGLAVMTELPLVVIDVQRAGPSTGMPTKPEQSDLLMALFGRHGESPIPVIAPLSPADSYQTLLTAMQMAVRFMTPVVLLSDAYIANGAEPWKIPTEKELPELAITYGESADQFSPYQRDEKTLVKPWTIPGTPGLEYRLGGLEKDYQTGNVSYDPDNHAKMVALRGEKIAGIAQDLPEAEIIGPEKAEILLITWGSSYGSALSAVEQLSEEGLSVSLLGLRHLNPFPKNLGKILKNHQKIVVAELNRGQLCRLLRAEFLIDAIPLNKITGKPFLIEEIVTKLKAL